MMTATREPAYTLTDRGFTVRGWYGGADGEGRIQIMHGDSVFKDVAFPGYKIWNIAAHFSEIVDDIITQHETVGR